MSETDYLNQIQQLVELQKVDDEIHDMRLSLENAPRELEDLQQRFIQADEKRNRILDKLSHLQEQKKRLSIEIDDDSARIKKSKNKMTQVSNQREYQAMVREMDHMEKSNRTREEERLTLLDELQTQNKALEEMDVEHGSIKKELDDRTANLQATQEAARDRLAVLNKQRVQFSAGIPKPIFQRYEFIRERLEHPVIVSVRQGICTGCHIAIPPQDFIELQTGRQILSCPNCQRLIFWNEHFEPDEEAGEEKTLVRESRQHIWPEDMMHGDSAPMQPDEDAIPWQDREDEGEEEEPDEIDEGYRD